MNFPDHEQHSPEADRTEFVAELEYLLTEEQSELSIEASFFPGDRHCSRHLSLTPPNQMLRIAEALDRISQQQGKHN